jgi:D-threonine aldolase
MIEYAGYRVADPDALETPAMLVFDDQLAHNISSVGELVGGGENLMVHVKTHKSAAVVRRQLEAGIAGFKCATLKELEMVLECGAPTAILAYPLVQERKVERLVALTLKYPEPRICACVSTPGHVELLGKVAAAQSVVLATMVDVDLGMHRTGVALSDGALALYQAIAAHPGLEPAGLHAYDGHEHITDPQAREASTQCHIRNIQAFRETLRAQDLDTPLVVGGGSFSFGAYARTDGMHGSPGTNVYWDVGYSRMMPDMPFRWAALILTQVVDCYPEQHTVTTDLGYKAICGDPPVNGRALLLDHEDAELRHQTEEHGVFSWPGELPDVGTYLLAVPGHVCPTTIRYPGSYLIDGDGEVIDFYPHTARDRQ